MGKRARRSWNASLHAPREWTLATATRKGSPISQTENFKRAKPKILIPTPGHILRKNVIQNDTCTPTFTAVVPPVLKTQTQEEVHQQAKSYRNAVHSVQQATTQTWTHHCNYSNVSARMGFWGSYSKIKSATVKKRPDDVPSRWNERDTGKAVIYYTKGIMRYKHKYMHDLDDPQGWSPAFLSLPFLHALDTEILFSNTHRNL